MIVHVTKGMLDGMPEHAVMATLARPLKLQTTSVKRAFLENIKITQEQDHASNVTPDRRRSQLPVQPSPTVCVQLDSLVSTQPPVHLVPMEHTRIFLVHMHAHRVQRIPTQTHKALGQVNVGATLVGLKTSTLSRSSHYQSTILTHFPSRYRDWAL